MANEDYSNIPEEYIPISMWGYVGYMVLFSIPCVGLIMLLIYSFGATKKINLRNFARSYLCIYVIAFVLGFLFTLLGGAAMSGLS